MPLRQWGTWGVEGSPVCGMRLKRVVVRRSGLEVKSDLSDWVKEVDGRDEVEL